MLGVASLVLVLASAVVLLALYLAPTGLSPVRDAVSDYGATRFHLGYRAMVVLLGAGAILLALCLGDHTDAGALGWLWAFGISRILIAGFMVDREPPPSREGRIHWLLAAVAFTSIAVAATSVEWTGAPGALGPLGDVVAAAAVGTLVFAFVAPLRRWFGLVERLLYAGFLVWLVIAAVDCISAS